MHRHGPTITASVCSAPVTATAGASVTVTVPPPAGMAMEPLLLVSPLFTVICRVAPPQVAGIPETATLETVAAVRLFRTPRPAVVQRGTAMVAAPSDPDEIATDAAEPMTAAASVNAPSPMARRHMTAGLMRA